MGHTRIHAWGDRVSPQRLLGAVAVVVEPRIPRLQPWGVSMPLIGKHLATTGTTGLLLVLLTLVIVQATIQV